MLASSPAVPYFGIIKRECSIHTSAILSRVNVMNVRVIIFSGIMTALIGAMLGLAVAKIGQRELRTKGIVIGGAILGFAVGAMHESVRQNKDQINSDSGEQDEA